MTIEVGELQTGTPPEPGVYVAIFADDPQTEVLSYFDGRSWGHGARNMLAAMHGVRKGERLPFFKRHWWTKALFWRTYRNDASAFADALRKVVKK